MYDTPLSKYRPVRTADTMGSKLTFGAAVVIWGNVERGGESQLEIEVDALEDVNIDDILVLGT